MQIQIYDSNSILVFRGDCEDWLFKHNCDTELEIALNQLELSHNDEITFYCEQTDTEYTIEKVLELIYD